MILNSKITPFTDYVLRAPLLPLSLYFDILENYSSEKAKQLYQKAIIREAINLASPDLVKQLDKWVKTDSKLPVEKAKKLELTFLKYLARMSSRCTPFGLFSGCSVGRTAAETKIILEDTDRFERFTQFDMQFWVMLLQEISKKKDVIPHLKYYPNNSIYKIGDFYRYIEYKSIETKREHGISALRVSTVLTELLDTIQQGMTVEEMITFLSDDEDEKAEATEFVLKLIDFQFLVSELDAVVTGSDNGERILDVLKKIPTLKNEYQMLEKILEELLSLDKKLAPLEKIYPKIKNNIKRLEIDFDEKYLFQTDLNSSTLVNTLNKNVSQKVLRAVEFLNGIQMKEKFQNQESFKKAFTQRYESRVMPLTTVLDTEIGIGYLQNQEMNDSHEVLEFLSLKSKETESKNELWTSYDYILQKKIQECMINGETEILLTEKDFPNFNNDFSNAPATFSVMFEVLEHEKVVIESSGNTSAAKLLGRFCTGNPFIHNLTKEIIQKEEAYYSDQIMAEIVHIPESRTGNILRRPVLRKHEISYLAKSGVPENDTIHLNDLWVSIENDTIILFSKKHNKKVIPCLSNAHNFSKNSLPLYHFLCDLQSQHTKPIYSFDWGVLRNHYIYFPRIVYRDIILSKAKWIVAKEEIMHFSKINDIQLTNEFLKWRSQRNIPRYVNWVNYDHALLFDFETQIGVELFLNSVKNKEKITLEEFLFTKKSVVQNQNTDGYCNQFILSFYKE
ncbi:lantibiotic dehydratase family protein [Flavobacterium collinsii]|uniref:Lant_dehydr_N domain-containing protein n=1 Tax=Flavobacterium collinsii TaxID=1114861 RepID=A0A9W4X5G6_9FLAO|nr:lantibiotic dehydratase family protein [Flavobacterium collinsii]CAI2769220.1 Lant_dehydr_N domain-containing protein [Flavobacterium collinsii]